MDRAEARWFWVPPLDDERCEDSAAAVAATARAERSALVIMYSLLVSSPGVNEIFPLLPTSFSVCFLMMAPLPLDDVFEK